MCGAPVQAAGSSWVLLQTHLVVGLDAAQPQQQLEAQQVVGAQGLQLQQLAQGHQLRPLQVLQGQLILEELGETQDLLRAGLPAAGRELREAQTNSPERDHQQEPPPPSEKLLALPGTARYS